MIAEEDLFQKRFYGEKGEFPPEFEIRCSHGLQVRARAAGTRPRPQAPRFCLRFRAAFGRRLPATRAARLRAPCRQ